MKKRNVFAVVLSYGIVCGIGWLASAGLAYMAYNKSLKKMALYSSISYVVFYIVFIGLFSAVWDSVRKGEKNCTSDIGDIKKGKRSSREFLAYSICSFILIAGAIATTLLPAFNLEENLGEAYNIQAGTLTGSNLTGKKDTEAKLDENQVSQFNPDPKFEIPPVSIIAPKPLLLSEEGKEYIEKFNKLNHYITNDEKMTAYSNKKFQQSDINGSGSLVTDEFKKFITEMMTRKGLPPPSDIKIIDRKSVV